MLKTINGGIQPTKATKYSAGIDLYANEDVVIGAGETVMIGVGVTIDVDYIKEIFIENSCEGAVEYAKRFYNDDYKKWFDSLKIGVDDRFEFELYKGMPLPTEEDIKGFGFDFKYDEEYLDYYGLLFNGIGMEEFLERHYLELHPRSSLRAKGLMSNTGIIDLDYKDEIKIIIHNPMKRIELLDNSITSAFRFRNCELGGFKNDNFKIKKGDKIAQILLKEHKGYLFGIESNEERKGGFGSTDK